jgi:hypothetical protein
MYELLVVEREYFSFASLLGFHIQLVLDFELTSHFCKVSVGLHRITPGGEIWGQPFGVWLERTGFVHSFLCLTFNAELDSVSDELLNYKMRRIY